MKPFRENSQTKSHTDPIIRDRGEVLQLGPFQYGPLRVLEHPVQQPDDEISIRDPTIKTVDRSFRKLPQSPHILRSMQPSMKSIDLLNDKESFIMESHSPGLIAFTQKSEATSQSKITLLKNKFLLKWRKAININQSVQRYLHLFDMAYMNSDSKCTSTYILDLIRPSSQIIQTFHFVDMLVLLLITIYYPLMISFSTPQNAVIVLVLSFQISNFSLQFLKMQPLIYHRFVHNGRVIDNIYSIAMHDLYQKALQLISMICSILLTTTHDQLKLWVYFCVLFVLSMIKLDLVTQQLKLYLFLIFSFYNFENIFAESLLKIIILLNCLTCLWSDVQTEYGWVTLESFDKNDISQAYLQSLYWIVSILSQNGSPSPTTNQQLLMTVFVSILSVILLAYILSKYSLNQQAEGHLGQFLKDNQIQDDLKYKIHSYFTHQQKYKHHEYLSKLSQPLRKEFNRWQRLKLLQDNFKGYSLNTLEQITDICEDLEFDANYCIIEEGQNDDCSLYFIIEGNASLVTRTQQIIKCFQRYEAFGEYSFYTQQARNGSIRTDGFTRVLKLPRAAFLALLTNSEKQIFHQIKDRILFCDLHPISCLCCRSTDHSIFQCPQLTYQPSREAVIKQYQYPFKMGRREAQRRKNKSGNSYQYQPTFKQIAEELNQLYSDNQVPSHFNSESQLPYDDVYIRDSYTSASKSIIKSHSLARQQSAYDQISLPNNDNIFLAMEQDHEFSNLQGNANDNDEFTSLVRGTKPKQTYATAGFGHESVGVQSIREPTHNTLNIILEKESSEYNSKDDDNMDETPPRLEQKLAQVPVNRKMDPRLTFNNNFDFQMQSNQMNTPLNGSYHGSQSIRQNSMRQSTLKPDSIRQNSGRSLTYTPIPSGNNSIRTLGNINGSQSIKPRKSTNSFISNKSFVPSPLNEILSRNIEAQEQRSIKSKRKTSRKKSTKTGTKVSIVPSSFIPFSGFENPINEKPGLDTFEQYQFFEIYLAHNNHTVTISQANRGHPKLKRLSHYFLNYRLSQMISKLKQKQLAPQQKEEENQRPKIPLIAKLDH